MKALFIATVAALMMASCGSSIYSEKTEPCTTSVTGDTITLAYQKPVPIFAKCADNLAATIVDVKDSRCPKGVQCIWAGTASVKLQLGEKFNIDLELGKQFDTTYNQQVYSFLLVDVFPYPTAGTTNPQSNTTALLRIIKSERPTALKGF